MNGLDVLLTFQRARDAAFSVLAARGFADFGAGSRILLPTRISNASRISIGRGVLIGAGSWLIVPAGALGPEDSPQRQQLGPGPNIVIKDRARINQTSISAVSRVTIEESVDIARGVYISDHSHSFGDPETPIRDQPIDRIAPVTVERGAWIGQNAVILPGVTIGAGAVIGANSVVREDVPAHTVAAGVPAKILRSIGS